MMMDNLSNDSINNFQIESMYNHELGIQFDELTPELRKELLKLKRKQNHELDNQLIELKK